MIEGWNRKDQPSNGPQRVSNIATSLPPLFNTVPSPTDSPLPCVSPSLRPLDSNQSYPEENSDASDAMVDEPGDRELHSPILDPSQDGKDEDLRMAELVKGVDDFLADIPFKNIGSVINSFTNFVQSLSTATEQRIEELDADKKRRRQDIQLWKAKHIGKEKFIDVSQNYAKCCTNSKVFPFILHCGPLFCEECCQKHLSLLPSSTQVRSLQFEAKTSLQFEEKRSQPEEGRCPGCRQGTWGIQRLPVYTSPASDQHADSSSVSMEISPSWGSSLAASTSSPTSRNTQVASNVHQQPDETSVPLTYGSHNQQIPHARSAELYQILAARTIILPNRYNTADRIKDLHKEALIETCWRTTAAELPATNSGVWRSRMEQWTATRQELYILQRQQEELKNSVRGGGSRVSFNWYSLKYYGRCDTDHKRFEWQTQCGHLVCEQCVTEQVRYVSHSKQQRDTVQFASNCPWCSERMTSLQRLPIVIEVQ